MISCSWGRTTLRSSSQIERREYELEDSGGGPEPPQSQRDWLSCRLERSRTFDFTAFPATGPFEYALNALHLACPFGIHSAEIW